MVKYSKGDVLNCKATLVAHQVNAFGVMGGGIAAAIWPLLTPESQNAYVEKCRGILWAFSCVYMLAIYNRQSC